MINSSVMDAIRLSYLCALGIRCGASQFLPHFIRFPTGVPYQFLPWCVVLIDKTPTRMVGCDAIDTDALMETSRRGNVVQRAWGGESQANPPASKIPPEQRLQRATMIASVETAGVVTRYRHSSFNRHRQSGQPKPGWCYSKVLLPAQLFLAPLAVCRGSGIISRTRTGVVPRTIQPVPVGGRVFCLLGAAIGLCKIG
jgi:hypothetical protein